MFPFARTGNTLVPQPGPTVLPRRTPEPGSEFVVTYTGVKDWGNGSPATVNGWSAKWLYPGHQKVTGLWNGTLAQNGQNVTVTDAGWNKTLATGGSVSFGFTGSYSVTNPLAHGRQREWYGGHAEIRQGFQVRPSPRLFGPSGSGRFF